MKSDLITGGWGKKSTLAPLSRIQSQQQQVVSTQGGGYVAQNPRGAMVERNGPELWCPRARGEDLDEGFKQLLSGALQH